MTKRIIQKRAEAAIQGAIATKPIGELAKQVNGSSPLDYAQSSGQTQVPWPNEWSTGYFGPGQPVSPVQTNEEQPRFFQYTPGYNLIYIPRSSFNLMSFDQLRGIADLSKEIRLCVELLKREIRGFDWRIRPDDSDDTKQLASEIKSVSKFFDRPDGSLYFDQWINACLEDILVIDALALNVVKTKDKSKIAAIETIDGATIKPLLNIRGKSPAPPIPAYTQILYGVPWIFLTRDDFIYQRFNTTTRHPYGRTAIENIVFFVNMAIRRDMFNMNYYTSGNIPEGLAGAPKEWTTDQIKAFQTYWDALLKGNPDLARTLRFVPADATKVYEFRRPNFDSGWEEWLFRVCAWAYGVSPSEFGIMASHGMGDSSFTEGQANVQFRMGVGPLMRYLRAVLTNFIKEWLKQPDLRFEWIMQDPIPDKAVEAQVAQTYLQNGVWSIDEVRIRNGEKPLGIPHFLLIGGQPVLLEDLMAGKINANPGGAGPQNIEGQVNEEGVVDSTIASQQPQSADSIEVPAEQKEKPSASKADVAAKTAEAKKFAKKAEASFKRGKGAMVPFYGDFLHSDEVNTTNVLLKSAENRGDIALAFAGLHATIAKTGKVVDDSGNTVVESKNANVIDIVELDGRKWIWKPIVGESEKMERWLGHDLLSSAIAYYKMAVDMKLDDVVPETKMENVKGEGGTLQEFVEGADPNEKPNMLNVDPDIIERIGMMDFVSGQQDRVKRNFLRVRNVAYAIDNSLSFSANHGFTSKRYWGNSAFSAVIGGHVISSWAKDALKRFLDDMKSDTDFAKEMGKLLPSTSIVFALNRAKQLYNSDIYPTIVLDNLK